jgi:hypothetical protein
MVEVEVEVEVEMCRILFLFGGERGPTVCATLAVVITR